MGAKTPEQVKYKNRVVKCEICGRKFMNMSALKSHHKFLHTKREPSKRLTLIKKREEAKKLANKVVPLHMLSKVISPESKEVEKNYVKEKSPDLAGKPVSVSRKPAFECPACSVRFPVYFTAFRHIQKNHTIDENGQKVAPNSPLLVKPIRIETCGSCHQEVRSTDQHLCPKLQLIKDQYHCLGCNQTFGGLLLFQHHIKGLHSDGAQNYFFPSNDEFTAWKNDLQEQSKIEFIKLNKQKTKEIYHCSHQGVSVPPTTKLCPSSITAREYSKGIHVCYFKDHYGHNVENVLLKNYSKYSISVYSRETDESKLETDDDKDIYLQLKKVLACIVSDSAKVDSTMLKELLGKAFEMAAILKHYQEEGHTSPVSKSLTDAQISKTLDDLKVSKVKRKLSPARETKKVAAKKVKKTTSTEKLENGVGTRGSRSSPPINKSVSFKNLTKEEEKSPKIKDEQPKSELKKSEETLITKNTDSVEQKLEDITRANRSLLQSPSSFNDSYKNFVDQNFPSQNDISTPKPKPKLPIKKKEVVKTKMGQFKMKPSTPPKTKEVVKEVPITPKVWKPVEIKYEVKEQENDCNILILKI